MEVSQVIHVNGGNGDIATLLTPYLKFELGSFQKQVITTAKPVVIESISGLYTTNPPRCLRVADLGCSSGPNTVLVIIEILEAIDEICHQLNHNTPEFQVFLNDLPSNDFNTIFKTLPAFYGQLRKEKGEKFGPCSIGLIEEAKVDSFNLPFYMPSYKEVEAIICREGSFYLDLLEIFDINWDGHADDDNREFMFDRFISGQKVAKLIRAAVEPLIACHFGDVVIDVLFNKHIEHVGDHLSKEEGKFVNFIISLRRK
ncbi:hypothetical protein NE237_024098 [Protea cynaroides]|uniref:Uncharacterized protein n=1 Tax=Protea cynaroides TaxID=273540 RepID=A0A9Q0K539_9MAGN|nr:hypothetical protein NE237_024098 [Protea cynaroides]